MKKQKLIITCLLASYVAGAQAGFFSSIRSSIAAKYKGIQNYFGQRTVDVKDKDGNVVKDENGNNKTAKVDNRGRKAIKDGIDNSIKAAITETSKEMYKNVILHPFIIKPLKKLFKLDQGSKAKKQMDEVNELAKTIENLKKVGAPRRKIAALSAKLSRKVDAIINNGSGKGKK